jgi:hypothetical protein
VWREWASGAAAKHSVRTTSGLDGWARPCLPCLPCDLLSPPNAHPRAHSPHAHSLSHTLPRPLTRPAATHHPGTHVLPLLPSSPPTRAHAHASNVPTVPGACRHARNHVVQATVCARLRPLSALPLAAQYSHHTMPATGGGRAAHAPPPKSKMNPSRRESSAVAPQTHRPGIKTRAYSAPSVPKCDSDTSNDSNRTDDDNEGEEIADDAFFQRYHFPQPVPIAQEEDAGSSADSSSDTQGPLSPTHVKDRCQAGDSVSEPSTGVSAFLIFVPRATRRAASKTE